MQNGSSSDVTARHRALALSLLILAAAYFIGVFANLFPETGPARVAPTALRSFAARLFKQQWQLFGPEVPSLDVSVRYRCGDEDSAKSWRDPEAEAIAAARTFRLRPENKAMHASRAVAAALYQEWRDRSASLCAAGTTTDDARVAIAERCPQAAEAVRASQAFARAIDLVAPQCKVEGEARFSVRLVVSDLSTTSAVQSVEIALGEGSCPP